MTKNKYPRGWDRERVERVISHHEQLSEEQEVADDAAYEDRNSRRHGSAQRSRAGNQSPLGKARNRQNGLSSADVRRVPFLTWSIRG